MSKEFEETVLKKLENLETEVKDTKYELQNLAKNTNKRLGKLEFEVKDTKYGLQNLAKNTNKRLGKLELEVRDTRENVKYLNNNFTKFDFEINTKIDTLFDAYKVNKEKNDALEGKMNSLEKETFNQDIRISNLEDKVLIA